MENKTKIKLIGFGFIGFNILLIMIVLLVVMNKSNSAANPQMEEPVSTISVEEELHATLREENTTVKENASAEEEIHATLREENATVEENAQMMTEVQSRQSTEIQDNNVNASNSQESKDYCVYHAEDASFYYTNITENLKNRMVGKSYPASQKGMKINFDDLAYLHLKHYDFAGKVKEGELICNVKIAKDFLEIFYELYQNAYPLEKVRLIDEYGGDDDKSMEDNNTSCFNYRTVAHKTTLSNHAYGLAIDVNPLYNPYVATRNGQLVVGPENGMDYIDRSATFEHKIDEQDILYQLMIQHGFTWGGSWVNSKDYQHFEKK